MDKVYEYFILVLATIFIFLTDFGIPFILAVGGVMLGFWQFSWGIVLIFYAICAAWRDAKNSLNWVLLFTGGTKDGD